eukprot:363953-Chlamydomonas_euryale.AAC.13
MIVVAWEGGRLVCEGRGSREEVGGGAAIGAWRSEGSCSGRLEAAVALVVVRRPRGCAGSGWEAGFGTAALLGHGGCGGWSALFAGAGEICCFRSLFCFVAFSSLLPSSLSICQSVNLFRAGPLVAFVAP